MSEAILATHSNPRNSILGHTPLPVFPAFAIQAFVVRQITIRAEDACFLGVNHG
uniref:Uncharacterized protein n=1 Tax=Neisseria meningitidis alpha275 TaxID=295996 RepID=C6SL64_NEIME|nr:hypothetical protein predicted by Glimmer/Critica [Neisseria meningitidis alpha275]